MPNLRVSHILVRGQPHRRAMGLELCMGMLRKHPIQIGGMGLRHRIAGAAISQSYTIHDYQNNRFIHSENSFSR